MINSQDILAIVYKHLQGKHDQKTHGRRIRNITVEGVGNPATKEKIISHLKKAISKAGVPNDISVVYSNKFGNISSDGSLVVADYQKDKRQITIYRNATSRELPSVLVHEYGHHVFRTVQEKANTLELVEISKKYNLFSKKPEFTKYVAMSWGKDIDKGINEAVSEVYRLQSEGKSNLVPAGWLAYANKVRELYDNLP